MLLRQQLGETAAGVSCEFRSPRRRCLKAGVGFARATSCSRDREHCITCLLPVGATRPRVSGTTQGGRLQDESWGRSPFSVQRGLAPVHLANGHFLGGKCSDVDFPGHRVSQESSLTGLCTPTLGVGFLVWAWSFLRMGSRPFFPRPERLAPRLVRGSVRVGRRMSRILRVGSRKGGPIDRRQARIQGRPKK